MATSRYNPSRRIGSTAHSENVLTNTFNRMALLPYSIAILFLLVLYSNVFASLFRQWWSNNLYTHGLLIPLISLYLIWIQRQKLSRLTPSPYYPAGFAIIITGQLMLLLGHVAGIITLQELSLIVTLTGMVALLLGISYLKALSLPIAYLLFGIPVWENLLDFLYSPFQILSARIAVVLIKLADIPIYNDGIYIQLPNITLEVAKGCSGIGYLISVMAIGIPLAHLFLKSWLRRVVLVLSVLIIAFLSNGLRIALIAFFAYHGYSEVLHGPYHVFQGLFVSMIGYAVIFIGVTVLSERRSKASIPSDRDVNANITTSRGRIKKRILFPTASACIIFAIFGSYIYLYTPAIVPLQKSNIAFPQKVGNWRGEDTPPVFNIYRELGVDREISRIYRTDSGNSLHLYIGYFEYQGQGKELVHHKTKDIHLDASRVRISLPSYGDIEVNKLFQKDKNRLVLFWYDINGNVVAGRFKAKLYLIWDYLFHGRTNGAVVMLTVNIEKGIDSSHSMATVEGFIHDIYPQLKIYLLPV